MALAHTERSFELVEQTSADDFATVSHQVMGAAAEQLVGRIL